MKLIHLYKKTSRGLERLTDDALSVKKAIKFLKVDPHLIARDAEDSTYTQIHDIKKAMDRHKRLKRRK
tara:strand:+ start:248 stop:451 length:204 start_codon:yes stop_codon:yes gene_type:complete